MILSDFTACGAHQQGHFLLSSGLHSADYLQCALFLAKPDRAAAAGQELAEALRSTDVDPDIVIAPAMGGLIIGHEVARFLGKPFLFTERENGVMTLRRGFALAPGQSVIIIEDVVTTGKSTLEVASILKAQGAEVLAIGSIVNRTGRPNPFEPLPYRCLVEASFATWQANACPLCSKGTPIAKPGSRPIA